MLTESNSVATSRKCNVTIICSCSHKGLSFNYRGNQNWRFNSLQQHCWRHCCQTVAPLSSCTCHSPVCPWTLRVVFFAYPTTSRQVGNAIFANASRSNYLLSVWEHWRWLGWLGICPITWLQITAVALHSQQLGDKPWPCKLLKERFRTFSPQETETYQIFLKSEVRGILWRCSQLKTSQRVTVAALSICTQRRVELLAIMLNKEGINGGRFSWKCLIQPAVSTSMC